VHVRAVVQPSWPQSCSAPICRTMTGSRQMCTHWVRRPLPAACVPIGCRVWRWGRLPVLAALPSKSEPSAHRTFECTLTWSPPPPSPLHVRIPCPHSCYTVPLRSPGHTVPLTPGVLLYCMAVGTPPFMAESELKLVEKVQSEAVRLPSDVMLEPHLKFVQTSTAPSFFLVDSLGHSCRPHSPFMFNCRIGSMCFPARYNHKPSTHTPPPLFI
jgi:hypothetical protein